MQPNSDPNKNIRRKSTHTEMDEVLHHDESNWLVSYADMMTLLFGFFVLMYSFSKLDKDKFKVVRKEVSTYFGGEMTEDESLRVIRDDLQNLMGVSEVDTGDFKTFLGDQRLVLQLNNELLFASGSAELLPEFKDVIRGAFEKIFANKVVESIVVEGHTDAQPMKSFIYPSNWELSAARGARIVRELVDFGVDKAKVSVHGFGDSRPLVPNKDKNGEWIKENLKKNRRVVILVDFGENEAEVKKSMESEDFVKVQPKKTAQRPGSHNPSAVSLDSQDPRKISSISPQSNRSVKTEADGSMAIDSLKNRLMQAQKKFEQANRKAQEKKKRRAEQDRLLQKIKQLEQRTMQLEQKEP